MMITAEVDPLSTELPLWQAPELLLHGEEVAALAGAIGAATGLSARDRARLELAARLHDIGKRELAPGIIDHAGPLERDAWSQVRLHPIAGEQILIGVGLGDIAAWVRSHHERFDGLGYPDGLSGSAIPAQARIIAVADAYAAMRSGRPYREVRSVAEARDELVAGAGTQFDPRVVATALRCLEPELSCRRSTRR